MATHGAHFAKKTIALDAILAGRTQGEAANLAGVSMRTMSRWNAEFKPILEEHQAALVDKASRRLAILADKAIDALEDNLSQDTPAYVRIGASKAVLDYLLKLRGLVEVEARLTKLEGLLDDN